MARVVTVSRHLFALCVLFVVLALPQVAAAQAFCAETCSFCCSSCDTPCVKPNTEPSTCGGFGVCEYTLCSSCTGASSCSQACSVWTIDEQHPYQPITCGQWGICGGGGGGSCASCTQYSKCSQQCGTAPYFHTCGDVGPCGVCLPDQIYSLNLWNDGSGNCVSGPFQDGNGADCSFSYFSPANQYSPAMCVYQCTLTCPNLR